MDIALRQPLSCQECELVRLWRNQPDVLPMLRSGYKTAEEQYAFYVNVICNPKADHQYYAIELNPPPSDALIGMGGLTYLSREPGAAEISLLLSPLWRGRGYGPAAVRVLLDEAWRSGLTSVTGFCFRTGPQAFWRRQLSQVDCDSRCWYVRDSLLWRWDKKGTS